ncbi:hypothetical protein [Anaerotignum sp.]|uniref:hypothetical protein n=1 Tax=Anaerotignum sp. TaxID=2039241 RepID=UPI0028A045F6|nr:hypothetical protein [Anaerotignum sp.]
MKRKYVALALSIMMSISGPISVFANPIGEQEIDSELAMKVAYGFLNARENSDSIVEGLPDDYSLESSLILYGNDDRPSAYKFDIMDEDNSYSGYIVIGAQEIYAPVIEYSFSDSRGFLDTLESNEKGYYVGGINYYAVEDDGSMKDIITGDEIENTVTKLRSNDRVEGKDYSKMWDEIYENFGSDQVISPMYIEDPADLEYGYDKLRIRNLYDGALASYRTKDDFPGDAGDCGPVAAVNMMILGYESYDLDLKDGSWTSVYNRLFDLSECDPDRGTYTHLLASGIEEYVTDCGYRNANIDWDWIDSETELMSNVKNDVFQIIQTQSPSLYDDHYVFAFGYEEYKYTNYSNVYFAIADGKYDGVRYIMYEEPDFLAVVTAEF